MSAAAGNNDRQGGHDERDRDSHERACIISASRFKPVITCWKRPGSKGHGRSCDDARAMKRTSSPASLEREKAVDHALDCLYAIARRESVFRLYDGHLLLALALAASTSRSRGLRRKATAMGRERARRWMTRWPRIRPRLDADSVLQQVIATDAVGRLGLTARRIQRDLRAVIAHIPTSALLYFHPAREDVPTDVPAECACGNYEPRGRRTCTTCGRRLKLLDPYEVWYYALTNAYFCERQGMPLSVRPADLLSKVSGLRPYPAAGTSRHYQAVYAATHIVYVLNDYGEARLSSRVLPRERAFLAASLQSALDRREPDTVAEIVESLLALGASDTSPLVRAGRAFLLATQRSDGGWGDADEYGRFHTAWAAIDALKDHAWKRRKITGDRKQFSAGGCAR